MTSDPAGWSYYPRLPRAGMRRGAATERLDYISEKAEADLEKVEYRWVTKAMKHVVFANPENAEAKNLPAGRQSVQTLQRIDLCDQRGK